MITKIKRYSRFFSEISRRSLQGFFCPENVINLVCDLTGIRYRRPNLCTIVLSVNRDCNLRCDMCDVGQGSRTGLDRLRFRQSRRYISLELVRKILAEPYIKKKKPDFSILMTEPLMHPQICRIVAMIKNSGHFVKLATNGILLEEKAEELIAAGIDEIQVSLDGDEQTHDSLRNKAGAYKKAVSGIRKVKREKNLRLVINYTVSNLNYDKINRFLETLDSQEVAVDLCKIQFMYYVSDIMLVKHKKVSSILSQAMTISARTDPGHVDTTRLIAELKNIKEKYKNIKKIDLIPCIRRASDIKRYFSKEGAPIKNNKTCYLPWNSLTINADGKVFVHARCFNYEYGDVARQDIAVIFFNERIKQFRRELARKGFCLPACTRCCGVMEFGNEALIL